MLDSSRLLEVYPPRLKIMQRKGPERATASDPLTNYYTLADYYVLSTSVSAIETQLSYRQ